jgi:hypothetical protein
VANTASSSAAIILAADNPAAVIPAAVYPAAPPPAEAAICAAKPEAASPLSAATAAFRECNKIVAGERRASARTSALAKRREGTPEVLRLPEKESFELDISLDLDDRDIVFSSPVSSILSEEEKNEEDDEYLEKIADRFVYLPL